MTKKDQLSQDSIDSKKLQLLQQRMELIRDDISGTKRLDDEDYKTLLSDIERESRLDHETLPDLFLSLHEDIEGLGKLVEKLDSPGLNAVGDLASLLSSGLKLIGYRRMGRKLTGGEQIIVGLCLVAMVLTVTSFAVGIGVLLSTGLVVLGTILSALVVTRAVISLVKTWQTIRVKEDELKETEFLAAKSELELDKLLSASKQPASSASQDTLKSLKAAIDEYVAQGYIIHRLRDAVHHPRKILTNRIHLAMGFLAIIGAVFLFIPPLTVVGAACMGLAGVISTGAVIANWAYHKHEKRAIQAQRALAIQEELASKTVGDDRHEKILAGYKRAQSLDVKPEVVAVAQSPTNDDESLDSTARELSELQWTPESEKPTPPVVDPLQVLHAPSIVSSPIDSPRKGETEDSKDDEGEHEKERP